MASAKYSLQQMLAQHPTPWSVKYHQRCDEWSERSMPTVIDANGKQVCSFGQHTSHPGIYDLISDCAAQVIVDCVNSHLKTTGVTMSQLDRRAKAYWPSRGYGDSTIVYSGHTSEENANRILDALLKAGATGGHIEQHVQGVGWVVEEAPDEAIYPHTID